MVWKEAQTACDFCLFAQWSCKDLVNCPVCRQWVKKLWVEREIVSSRFWDSESWSSATSELCDSTFRLVLLLISSRHVVSVCCVCPKGVRRRFWVVSRGFDWKGDWLDGVSRYHSQTLGILLPLNVLRKDGLYAPFDSCVHLGYLAQLLPQIEEWPVKLTTRSVSRWYLFFSSLQSRSRLVGK